MNQDKKNPRAPKSVRCPCRAQKNSISVRGYMNRLGVSDSEKWNPPLYFHPNQVLSTIEKTDSICNADEFNGGIIAGKNTYSYDAHTYHTKVPPQGIEILIEHFTKENDVVLDPFCGSGMTGVAATKVNRQVILSDLSPAATFIAYNYIISIDPEIYLNKVKDLLISAEELERFLYNTTCKKCGKKVPMLYEVWSFGVICPHCEKEFIIWDVARDEKDTVKESKIKKEFACPLCNTQLLKRSLKRTKLYPVQIGYKCCNNGMKEHVKTPDQEDVDRYNDILNSEIPYWYPKNKFLIGVNTKQPISAGLDSIDKLYTKRALFAYSYLWDKSSQIKNYNLRSKMLFTLTSLYQRITLLSEFRFWGGSGNIANLNVPSIINEQNVFKTFLRKAKTIYPFLQERSIVKNKHLYISTQSACNLFHIQDQSVDYVFTDPPFGANINYSEMNFLWESWLQKYTNNEEEAIINKYQHKSFREYELLLTRAFLEINRVLKKNSWFTVMFHNSSEKVWQCLQQAIKNSGFSVISAQTFDKKHGTFKQFVSKNAVGYDLTLHCKKRQNDLNFLTNTNLKKSVENFIDKVKANMSNYKITYLHVNRDDEIDYRKMYSEWIIHEIKTSEIDLSYEGFRVLAEAAIFGGTK